MSLKINLNTGNGQASFETAKLIGKLDALILNSNYKVELMIESEYGYLIFKDTVEGIRYVAPRIVASNVNQSAMEMPNSERFNLDEKLIVTVIGQNNVDVSVEIRFE